MPSDGSPTAPRGWADGAGSGGAGAFAQPTLIIRWVTATIALLSVTIGRSDTATGWLVAGAVAVSVVTLLRTVRPIHGGVRQRALAITLELTVVAVATVATGGFASPFVSALIPPVAVAAFSGGAVWGLIAALSTGLAVGAPMVFDATPSADADRLVIQWVTELVLVALVAGYAFRILVERDEQRRQAEDTVNRLADANQLLVTLHEVTQDLPASLDLGEALDSVFEHVRSLVPVNYGGIALRDDAGDTWRFAAHLGVVDPRDGSSERLAAIRGRLDTCALVAGPPDDLLYPQMSDGRYVALRSRGELIGILAVEHNTARLYDRHHDEALVLVAESAALAIDNARLFDRLRHLGAAEERARIARDLHDRMGQSLAYLGFELDRISRAADGTLIRDDLDRVRSYLREITGEVRETLYDLRSDTDESRSVVDVLEEFGARVEARSGMAVDVDIPTDVGLPRLRERELCRITKEALVNAERHSGGTHAQVAWTTGPDGVQAEVRDDGRGMTTDDGRDDSYGLVGMRERAAAIGGHLSIDSITGGGTVVRINVPTHSTSDTRRVPA